MKTSGAGKAFILFSLILVTLALLELAFRLFVFPDWRIISRVRFEQHPIYNTFQKPNLTIRRYNPPNYDVVNSTNSMGFRDQENGFENDLESIWVSGMSNSYGGFVNDDEVFARRLEITHRYRNALLASEGHVLPNQVAVMRHLHKQGYRPQLVLLELSLNNVLRSYANGVAALKEPFFVPETSDSGTASERAVDGLRRRINILWTRLISVDFIGVKLRLINNSAVYAWLKVGINANPVLRTLTRRLGLRADPALSDSVPVSMLSKGPSGQRIRLVRELADYTAMIAAWSQSVLGAEFGVILIPSKHQMNPAWFDRYLAFLGRDRVKFDASVTFMSLKSALEQRNISVLDLSGPLVRAGHFYNFPDDGHVNADGHAVIARELALWLKTHFKRNHDR